MGFRRRSGAHGLQCFADDFSGGGHDVHVEWSSNEKAALEMLAGASFAGARTLFTCTQVGLTVAAQRRDGDYLVFARRYT